MARLWLAVYSDAEIAKQLGVPATTFRRFCKSAEMEQTLGWRTDPEFGGSGLAALGQEHVVDSGIDAGDLVREVTPDTLNETPHPEEYADTREYRCDGVWTHADSVAERLVSKANPPRQGQRNDIFIPHNDVLSPGVIRQIRHAHDGLSDQGLMNDRVAPVLLGVEGGKPPRQPLPGITRSVAPKGRLAAASSTDSILDSLTYLCSCVLCRCYDI